MCACACGRLQSLSEEGAAIVAYKLVQGGIFNEAGISQLLKGTRNLADNLSDLRAQVAANKRGAILMQVQACRGQGYILLLVVLVVVVCRLCMYMKLCCSAYI